MRPRSTRATWSWILSVALLIGACAAGSGPLVPTGSPTVLVTASPTTVAPATATVSAPGTTAPAGIPATPTLPPPPSSTQPPDAALAAEGGDPFIGQLGSFTWANGGSDSPSLPGAPLTVGAGERLTVSIAAGVGVADWTARRVRSGSTDGAGAIGLGSGSATITFVAPPPGTWSVQLTVRFAADLGTATYYWKLTVR